MADENTIYETRTMLEILRQSPPVRRFFRDTFFPREVHHETRTVQFDFVKTKRRIAAFTGPMAAGRVVERAGFETREVAPAYIKEKIPTRVTDLLHRTPGEDPYHPMSVLERAAARVGADLHILDERVARREELMCAQALIDGKLEIRGEGISADIDFGYTDGEHRIILSGGDCWDHSNGDPMMDLDDWRTEVNKRSGVLPNRVIVGGKVYRAIIDNPKVKERLDTRRIELGEINPADLPGGVRYLGFLKPSMLDIYAYDEWYTNPEDGKDYPIVPEDVVLLGSNQARCAMHYGLIQNVHGMTATSRFAHSWVEDDGSARYLQLESAPLPNLYQPDAFLVAKVLS